MTTIRSRLRELTLITHSDQPLYHGQNPVEWREQLRHARGSTYRTINIVHRIIMGLIIFIMLAILVSIGSYGGLDDFLETSSIVITIVIVFFQMMMVLFIVPTLTASTFVFERTQETLEMLLTTTLTSDQIVRGKIMAAVPHLIRLIFAIALILIPALVFVQETEITIAIVATQCVLLVHAIFILVFTTYLSSRQKSTINVLVTTYVVTIFSQVGLLLLVTFLFEFSPYSSDIEFWPAFSIMAALGNIFLDVPRLSRAPEVISWVSNILIHIAVYSGITYAFYRATVRRLNQARA